MEMMTLENLKIFFLLIINPFLQKKTHLNFVWNNIIDGAK